VHHEQALSGDDTAVDWIVAELLAPLRYQLRKGFSTAPKDWIHDAVVDALLEYRTRPGRYDMSRGISLSRYLLFAARRNLINRLSSEARRGGHETTVPADRLPEPAVHAPQAVSGESSATIPIPENDFSEPERIVLQLWRTGERRTRIYAQALKLSSLPANEQRIHVKRIKDRVVQRVRRWARRSDGTDTRC
jgi:DNA-directed RNA polymerase specialized sigma24 family protein